MVKKSTKKKPKIKRNNIILISFIVLVVIAVFVFNFNEKAFQESKCNASEGEWNETYQTCLKESEITYCQKNQRNVDVCIQVYDPVCGFTSRGKKETFSNSCFACSNPEVNFYVPGECKNESKA